VSAGFEYAGKVYWGTNAAIELCLEAMIDVATQRLPREAPVAVFLRDWRDAFFPGAVVGLDEILDEPGTRAQFAELLGGAMRRMTEEDGGLTERGREWVDDVLVELRSVLTSTLPPAR
jgi:hypothetical protein